MKIRPIIILLFFAIKTFSQNEQLVSNTWYLTKLVEGNIEYYPPIDSTIPSVPLVFEFSSNQYLLSTTVCNGLVAPSISFDDANNTFSYVAAYTTLGKCENPAYDYFDQKYLNFFMNPVSTTYSYTITEYEDDLSLIITGISGNQAYYTNQMLNIYPDTINEISFYPNPTHDLVNLRLSSKQSGELQIFDIAGQQIFHQMYSELPETVDFSNYARGLYIIKIQDHNGQHVERVCKK